MLEFGSKRNPTRKIQMTLKLRERSLIAVILLFGCVRGLLSLGFSWAPFGGGALTAQDVEPIASALMVLSCIWLGILRGKFRNEKQVLVLGGGSLLLAILASGSWGNASSYISNPGGFVGLCLGGIFSALLQALVIVGAVAVLFRFLVFSSKESSPTL